MLYTSAQANKLLLSLQDEEKTILKKENLSSVFVAATSEDPEKVRPQEYDFGGTRSNLSDVRRKIRTVKHAINQFNVATEIPGFGMTIDQMLVYLPQLSDEKRRLNGMANRLQKQRAQYRMTTPNVIDYEYANYNIAEAQNMYNTFSDELAKAQLALDTVNTTVQFPIDI